MHILIYFPPFAAKRRPQNVFIWSPVLSERSLPALRIGGRRFRKAVIRDPLFFLRTTNHEQPVVSIVEPWTTNNKLAAGGFNHPRTYPIKKIPKPQNFFQPPYPLFSNTLPLFCLPRRSQKRSRVDQIAHLRLIIGMPKLCSRNFDKLISVLIPCKSVSKKIRVYSCSFVVAFSVALSNCFNPWNLSAYGGIREICG